MKCLLLVTSNFCLIINLTTSLYSPFLLASNTLPISCVFFVTVLDGQLKKPGLVPVFLEGRMIFTLFQQVKTMITFHMSNSQKKMRKSTALECSIFLSNENNDLPHFSKNFLFPLLECSSPSFFACLTSSHQISSQMSPYSGRSLFHCIFSHCPFLLDCKL